VIDFQINLSWPLKKQQVLMVLSANFVRKLLSILGSWHQKKSAFFGMVWKYQFFQQVIYVTADTNRNLHFIISGNCFKPLPEKECSCFFSQRIPLDPTVSACCLEKFKSRTSSFISLC